MKARIHVTLKPGVLDPQGTAIKKSLDNLGIDSVSSVTHGKYFEITLNENDKQKAEQTVEERCKSLLANTVIENYSFEIIEA